VKTMRAMETLAMPAAAVTMAVMRKAPAPLLEAAVKAEAMTAGVTGAAAAEQVRGRAGNRERAACVSNTVFAAIACHGT
jgi:hypothetical protein